MKASLKHTNRLLNREHLIMASNAAEKISPPPLLVVDCGSGSSRIYCPGRAAPAGTTDPGPLYCKKLVRLPRIVDAIRDPNSGKEFVDLLKLHATDASKASGQVARVIIAATAGLRQAKSVGVITEAADLEFRAQFSTLIPEYASITVIDMPGEREAELEYKAAVSILRENTDEPKLRDPSAAVAVLSMGGKSMQLTSDSGSDGGPSNLLFQSMEFSQFSAAEIIRGCDFTGPGAMEPGDDYHPPIPRDGPDGFLVRVQACKDIADERCKQLVSSSSSSSSSSAEPSLKKRKIEAAMEPVHGIVMLITGCSETWRMIGLDGQLLTAKEAIERTEEAMEPLLALAHLSDDPTSTMDSNLGDLGTLGALCKMIVFSKVVQHWCAPDALVYGRHVWQLQEEPERPVKVEWALGIFLEEEGDI